MCVEGGKKLCLLLIIPLPLAVFSYLPLLRREHGHRTVWKHAIAGSLMQEAGPLAPSPVYNKYLCGHLLPLIEPQIPQVERSLKVIHLRPVWELVSKNLGESLGGVHRGSLEKVLLQLPVSTIPDQVPPYTQQEYIPTVSSPQASLRWLTLRGSGCFPVQVRHSNTQGQNSKTVILASFQMSYSASALLSTYLQIDPNTAERLKSLEYKAVFHDQWYAWGLCMILKIDTIITLQDLILSS